MTTRNRRRRAQTWVLPLALLGVLALATPSRAFEREGTMLYFSWEDLQHDLRHLLPHDNLSSLIPQMNWQSLRTEQQYDNGPIERSLRSGNGQGADDYRLPGMRPLWGY
ncbi:MAG: hypothetical protein AB7G75_18385 [Candidatus Binatia bacterium]